MKKISEKTQQFLKKKKTKNKFEKLKQTQNKTQEKQSFSGPRKFLEFSRETIINE